MNWKPDRYSRLRALLRGERVAEEVEEEFEHHLQLRTEKLIASGLTPAQARAEALRRFGDVDRLRQVTSGIDQSMVKEQKRMEIMEALTRELKHAFRGLIRAPGFSSIALVTLMLGMGASIAVYTLLHAVVLNPLPYADSNQLVRIQSAVPGIGPGMSWGLSPAQYFHYRERSRALSDLVVYSSFGATLQADREATVGHVLSVSPNLMSVLGAKPALGRLFAPADGVRGSPRVAMLSHEYWQTGYGGDPTVIGKKVLIDADPIEIVGVVEAGFALPGQDVEIYMPRRMNPEGPFYNEHFLTAIGRLRPGATVASLDAELAQLIKELPGRYPVAYTPDFMQDSGFSPDVQQLQAAVVGSSAKTLWILFGAVAVVLLIACANVANLFLVRAETRRNEIAIRSALGAERAHLFVQSLAESMTIALVAGTAGVWLAYGALKALIAIAPTTLPRLAEVRLDSSTLLFAAGITVAAALMFALFPLVRQRFDYGPLREGGRGLTASRAQLRVRSALVALQVALAIVLLSAAGLMLRSFSHMLAVKTGIDEKNVLAVDIVLPFQAYNTYERTTQYWQTLSDQLKALPGVTQVGGGLGVPLEGDGFGCAVLHAKPASEAYTGCIPNNIITPGFFEALGVRVRGRVPTWSDINAGTGAVVISEGLAKYLWPNQDAIGKGVRVPQNQLDVWYQVVGVAEDIRSEGVNRPAPAMVFYPVKAIEGAPLWQPRNAMTVLVRTSTSNPEQLAPSVRRIAQQLERGAAIGDVRTMEHVVSRSMSGTSFTMMLLGVAGGMALLISVVGLYGVIAYTVSRRRSELGIRMALGAARSDVGGMVVMQSVRLAAIGVAIGLFGTLFTTQMLNSMLFGVKPTDPLTLTSVSFLLLLVAAMAAFLPAWRASSVSPVEALKS